LYKGEKDMMALSRKTGAIIIVILLLAAFLGGFIPMYLKNQELAEQVKAAQSNLEAAQDQLRSALLQNALGLMLVEVEQNNFGLAQERSTRFFDDLRQAMATVRDDKTRARWASFLKRRDEITADLTALNPETPAKLRTLYLEFSQGTLSTPSP
jgi:type II secretory pathway pseudopilin PulG